MVGLVPWGSILAGAFGTIVQGITTLAAMGTPPMEGIDASPMGVLNGEELAIVFFGSSCGLGCCG